MTEIYSTGKKYSVFESVPNKHFNSYGSSLELSSEGKKFAFQVQAYCLFKPSYTFALMHMKIDMYHPLNSRFSFVHWKCFKSCNNYWYFFVTLSFIYHVLTNLILKIL